MDTEFIGRMYGTARFEPAGRVVAGSQGTWRLTYTVGAYGFDDGGTLKIAWRFATDWGFPQTDDPAGPNYLTVSTTGAAHLSARFDPKGGVRPWRKCVVIDVFDDGLRPGDEVTITYGDTLAGSVGARAQTFCEDTFEFRVLVDPIATGEFTRLPTCAEIAIVSGRAAKLVCICPSDVHVGQPFEVLVKAEDEWGNPSRAYSGTVRIDTDGTGMLEMPSGGSPALEDAGLIRLSAVATCPGTVRVTVSDDELGQSAAGNPITIHAQAPVRRRLWGDLHGQTEATVGTNTVSDYFGFARTYAGLDFACHQGNDFQVTKENWRETQQETNAANEAGKFVAFLGYEWSGNTGVGGDHNVIYLRDDESIYRSSHALVGDKSDAYLDRSNIEALYDEMRGHDALVIPHVGGRRADLSRLDSQVVKLVEVYSAWGMFEWMLHKALRAGHRVGVVANSDGHKCRPGASYPGATTFGVYGGLTCALADELTKESVFQALQQRRCYATTGQRIWLDVSCSGAGPGSELTVAEPPVVSVSVAGTAGVERIDILRCVQGDDPRIDTLHTYRPESDLSADRFRVAWSGARIYGRDRKSVWQGTLQVEGARISQADPWALDSPVERVEPLSDTEVTFDTITCGDPDGVVLRLEAMHDPVLEFRSAICSFITALDDLGAEPLKLQAGGIDQRVEVSRLPAQDLPQVAQIEFADTHAPEGDLAYWVRVVQEDGARAWSSPIFVSLQR